jgi:hypothetical protein
MIRILILAIVILKSTIRVQYFFVNVYDLKQKILLLRNVVRSLRLKMDVNSGVISDARNTKKIIWVIRK